MLVPIGFAGVMVAVTSSPAYALFALLSPVMLGANLISERRSGKRAYSLQLEEFRAQIAQARDNLGAARLAEIAERRRTAPDFGDLLLRVSEHREDIWERRRRDTDFMAVRLGMADQPSLVSVSLAEGGDEGLRSEAGDLLDDDVTVPMVPVTADLKSLSPLGLAGPRPRVNGLGRALVTQLAVLHSPADLWIAAVLSENSVAEWDFLSGCRTRGMRTPPWTHQQWRRALKAYEVFWTASARWLP